MLIGDEVSRFDQVNRLRQALHSLDSGDSGLLSMVGAQGMTRAFFPGANGLILGEQASHFPVGGTLVLGSNFGAKEKFRDPDGRLLSRADETYMHPTWSGLRARFSATQLEECFFTNAWPFLHSSPASAKQRSSNLGTPQRWLKNSKLMTDCLAFFRLTLREVRPQLVVALGNAPAAFLGHAFPVELGTWRACSLAAINALPYASVYSEHGRFVCCAMLHPSQANVNFRWRPPQYRGVFGERLLLQQAFALAEQNREEQRHG